MSRLTEQEKQIVYAACQLIENDVCAGTCTALRRLSRDLMLKYGDFYNGSDNYLVGDWWARGLAIETPVPEEDKSTRILMLLTFAELG